MNNYLIYLYIDFENGVFYVGLTCDKYKRKYFHKHKGSVFNYFTSINKPIPNPIYVMDCLTSEQAQFWEDWYKKELTSQGFITINRGKTGIGCGSLGKKTNIYTKDAVFELSKECSSRKDFFTKYETAYYQSLRNGWLNEMVWLKRPTQHNFKWTKDLVFEESRKYVSRKDFKKYSVGAYNVAYKNNWLCEMEWLKRPISSKLKWTKNLVFEEGKKYTKLTDFIKNSSRAYEVARKNGWLKEMNWFETLKRKDGYWKIKENVINEGKKCKNKTEFKKKCRGGYEQAIKNGWLCEIFA